MLPALRIFCVSRAPDVHAWTSYPRRFQITRLAKTSICQKSHPRLDQLSWLAKPGWVGRTWLVDPGWSNLVSARTWYAVARAQDVRRLKAFAARVTQPDHVGLRPGWSNLVGQTWLVQPGWFNRPGLTNQDVCLCVWHNFSKSPENN